MITNEQDRKLGKFYLVALLKREGKTEMEIAKFLEEKVREVKKNESRSIS